MKLLLLAIASLLQLPALKLAMRLTDRLPAGGGVRALLLSIGLPPAIFASGLVLTSPRTLGISLLCASLGGLLTAAMGMALLMWCKRVGWLTFVWADEQGGGLFLGLVSILFACWGALTAIPADMWEGAMIALMCALPLWLQIVYRARTMARRLAMGNIVTATLVLCMSALPALMISSWL